MIAARVLTHSAMLALDVSLIAKMVAKFVAIVQVAANFAEASVAWNTNVQVVVRFLAAVAKTRTMETIATSARLKNPLSNKFDFFYSGKLRFVTASCQFHLVTIVSLLRVMFRASQFGIRSIGRRSRQKETECPKKTCLSNGGHCASA